MCHWEELTLLCVGLFWGNIKMYFAFSIIFQSSDGGGIVSWKWISQLHFKDFPIFTGLCEGNSPVTGGSPHKGPVAHKMFPSDDFIMDFGFLLPLDFCVHPSLFISYPDSKVPGANMGPIWGRQDPGGPHVGPRNFAIWVGIEYLNVLKSSVPSTFNMKLNKSVTLK